MKSLMMDEAPSRTRSLITTALVAIGLVVLAFAADAMVGAFATADPLTHRVTLSGDDVAVWNLAGLARLEAGSGSSIVVTVNQEGADAGELKLEQSPIGGRTTLRIVYPGDRIVYPEMGRGSNTTVHVRSDGTFGGKRHDNNGGDWFGGTGNVRISGSGSGLEAHADLDVSIPRGRKFTLYVACGAVTVSNVDGDLKVDTGSGTVNSTHTHGKLAVDTGSGDVNVGGAEGPVSIDTGSGDVNVSDVEGEQLKVDTGSGTIRARAIGVDELSLDTGPGGVEAASVKAGRIAVDTGSGSVALGLDVMARAISVDTGSGDVTLRVPRDAGAEISFESGSGGIDAAEDLPVQMRKVEHGTYRGRLGDGSARVVVETGSGDLRLAANERTRR